MSLTILIPSYNHENYIADCLNSFINVGAENIKFLVIDDGSTDNTVMVVKNFKKDNPFLSIEIHEKKNTGLVSSLNLGLSIVNTKYIYLIASDDIPNIHGVFQAVDYLKKHDACQFFIGGGENFFENGTRTPIYGMAHERFFSLTKKKRNEEVFFNYPSPILLQSTVFKVDALKSVGGWDKNIKLDDFPMFVKLFQRFGVKDVDFVFNPNVFIVNYRHHGVNTYRNTIKQFEMTSQSLRHYCPNELLDRSIGRAFAYYFLVSLKEARFKNAFFIIKSVNFIQVLWFFYFCFFIVLSKLKF